MCPAYRKYSVKFFYSILGNRLVFYIEFLEWSNLFLTFKRFYRLMEGYNLEKWMERSDIIHAPSQVTPSH